MFSERQLEKAIVGIYKTMTAELVVVFLLIILAYIIMKKYAYLRFEKHKYRMYLGFYFIILMELMVCNKVPNAIRTEVEWIPFIRIFEGGVIHETRVIGSCINTLLYIPVGYLLNNINKSIYFDLLYIGFLSVSIEVAQWFYCLGTYKTENIISTMVGGLLGMYINRYLGDREGKE